MSTATVSPAALSTTPSSTTPSGTTTLTSTTLTTAGLDEVPLRATVHERVRETLRQDILSGVLPPGTHLRQSALAVRLQVSVSPVREALRELAAEGFVRFDPRRGATVRLVDLAELQEIRLLTEQLEPLVARLAVDRATAADLDGVRFLLARLEGAATVDDHVPLGAALHAAVVATTRSPRLQALVDSLDGASAPAVAAAVQAAPHRVAEAVAEHRAIVEALAARDADALCAAALAHRRATFDLVEDLVRTRVEEDR